MMIQSFRRKAYVVQEAYAIKSLVKEAFRYQELQAGDRSRSLH